MLYNLGCAWFHIGELRFELLLSSYGLDPALKYAFKHSHALEKMSLVELDIKVCSLAFYIHIVCWRCIRPLKMYN